MMNVKNAMHSRYVMADVRIFDIEICLRMDVLIYVAHIKIRKN